MPAAECWPVSFGLENDSCVEWKPTTCQTVWLTTELQLYNAVAKLRQKYVEKTNSAIWKANNLTFLRLMEHIASIANLGRVAFAAIQAVPAIVPYNNLSWRAHEFHVQFPDFFAQCIAIDPQQFCGADLITARGHKRCCN